MSGQLRRSQRKRTATPAVAGLLHKTRKGGINHMQASTSASRIVYSSLAEYTTAAEHVTPGQSGLGRTTSVPTINSNTNMLHQSYTSMSTSAGHATPGPSGLVRTSVPTNYNANLLQQGNISSTTVAEQLTPGPSGLGRTSDSVPNNYNNMLQQGYSSIASPPFLIATTNHTPPQHAGTADMDADFSGNPTQTSTPSATPGQQDPMPNQSSERDSRQPQQVSDDSLLLPNQEFNSRQMCNKDSPILFGSNFDNTISSLLTNSVSQSTSLSYKRGLLAFKEFRRKFGLKDTWPILLKHICEFIAYLFEMNLSQATIKCYLAGLSFVSKLNNFEDPTQKFIVKKLVEGVGRSRSKCKDPRLPITYEILVKLMQILPYICTSTYETKLFAAAFSIAYYGLLRVGELAISNGQKSHIIQISHVTVVNGTLKVKIPSSKTDQLGRGCDITILPEMNKSVCPVSLYIDYMKARPKIIGPVFCHYDGSAVTRYQFVAVLKQSLKKAGISCDCYSSHSFRIGRASSLSVSGVPDNVIKKLGRWKSEAYKTYLRL